MGEHHVRVSVPSIRIKQCTQGFYQVAETCAGKTSSPRGPADHVFRQHATNGSVPGETEETTSVGYNTPGAAGVCNQPREVPAATNPTDSISKFPNRLQRNENQTDGAETNSDGG